MSHASKPVPRRSNAPRSVALMEAGVRTSKDFVNAMSALMGDIVSGRVSPVMARSITGAGNALLRVVEMQHKYGKAAAEGEPKVLTLAS